MFSQKYYDGQYRILYKCMQYARRGELEIDLNAIMFTQRHRRRCNY